MIGTIRRIIGQTNNVVLAIGGTRGGGAVDSRRLGPAAARRHARGQARAGPGGIGLHASRTVRSSAPVDSVGRRSRRRRRLPVGARPHTGERRGDYGRSGDDNHGAPLRAARHPPGRVRVPGHTRGGHATDERDGVDRQRRGFELGSHRPHRHDRRNRHDRRHRRHRPARHHRPVRTLGTDRADGERNTGKTRSQGSG